MIRADVSISMLVRLDLAIARCLAAPNIEPISTTAPFT